MCLENVFKKPFLFNIAYINTEFFKKLSNNILFTFTIALKTNFAYNLSVLNKNFSKTFFYISIILLFLLHLLIIYVNIIIINIKMRNLLSILRVIIIRRR